MPRVRKGDVVWVEPRARRRDPLRRVDARRPPARAGLPGAARGQGGEEVHRERAPLPEEIRSGKRVLKLSNLDKPFWPEEGITKGDLLAYYRDVAPVLVPHLQDRPFTMKRYPDGCERQVLLPEGRPEAHAGLDPDAAVRGLDARQAAEAAADRLRARERRARAALDGEHGLHRHEHLVLARRQAVAARLGALRPRPLAGRRLRRDDPGRAADQADARRCSGSSRSRRRAAPRGSTSSCRSRAATPTRRRASSRRSSPARSRASHPRPRDDRVDEGEAPRRPDRLEPERRGQDDRVGLLGAAEARRAGLDAAALGRGERVARSRLPSRWTPCWSGSRSTATSSRAC